MLTLATIGILYPAALRSTHASNGEDTILALSRFTSFAMLLTYFASIYFQVNLGA